MPEPNPLAADPNTTPALPGAAAPAGWRWHPAAVTLGVFWAAGLGIAAYRTSGSELQGSSGIALAVGALLSGAAVAVAGSLPRRSDERRRLSGWLFIIAVIALYAPVRMALMPLVPEPDVLGEAERFALLPILGLLVVGVGRALNTSTLVTWVVFLLMAADLSTPANEGDRPTGIIAAGGARELQAAQRARVVDLQTALRTPTSRAALPPSAVDSPSSCARARASSQRRSLFGLPSRQAHASIIGCWSEDGEPVAVQLLADLQMMHAPAKPRLLRLEGGDPFGAALTPATPLQPVQVRTSDAYASTVRAFTPDGSVALGAAEHTPVQLRVSADGAVITVTAAWLLTEPARPRSGVQTRRRADDADYRTARLGRFPRVGEVIDVIQATVRRGGGGEVRVIRLRHGDGAAAVSRRG